MPRFRRDLLDWKFLEHALKSKGFTLSEKDEDRGFEDACRLSVLQY